MCKTNLRVLFVIIINNMNMEQSVSNRIKTYLAANKITEKAFSSKIGMTQ